MARRMLIAIQHTIARRALVRTSGAFLIRFRAGVRHALNLEHGTVYEG